MPPTPAWDGVRAVLGNFTYTLDTGDSWTVVLATSQQAHADAGTVLVRGPVLFRALHPDFPGRMLLVLEAASWQTPILFR